MAFVNGAPWAQQHSFNTSQTADIDGAWTAGTSIGAAAAWHSVVFIKDYVYCIGGRASASTFRQAKYRATVSSGSVGSWSASGTFNFDRAQAAAVVAGSKCYLIGGLTTGSVGTAEILQATIAADGTLGDFSVYSVSLPVANYGHRAAIIKDKLYVFGGQTSSVYVAELDSNGEIEGSFTAANSLAYANDWAALIVTESRVYLAGGRNNLGTPITTIQYAPINANGTLGTWQTHAYGLSRAQWGGAVVVVGSKAYIFGGRDASSVVNTIGHITFDSNDDITSTYYYTMTNARNASHAFVTSSRVYVVGGINSSGTYIATSEYIAFSGGANDYTSRLSEADPVFLYGDVQQLEAEASGSGEVLQIVDGTVDQDVPVANGTGSAHLAGTADVYQLATMARGFSYDGPYGSYGYAEIEQRFPRVAAKGDNRATIGSTEQPEPISSGVADTPVVAMGSVRAWIPKQTGFAYTGLLSADIRTIQPIPVASGAATTWNIGRGVSEQSEPSAHCSGSTPVNLVGFASVNQQALVASGMLVAGVGAMCAAEQHAPMADGKAFIIPIGHGSTVQDNPSAKGFVAYQREWSTLSFNDDDRATVFSLQTAPAPLALSFNRPPTTVGQTPAQVSTPLAFTR